MLQAATAGTSNEVTFVMKLTTESGYQAAIDRMKRDAREIQAMYSGLTLGGGGSAVRGGTAVSGEAAARAAQQRESAATRERVNLMKQAAQEQIRAEQMVRREIERTEAVRRVSTMRAIEGAKLLANGVTQAARAFMLLGVSSEESMEKAIRKFAQFEAVVHAGTGLASMAQGGSRMLGALGVSVTGAGLATAGGAALAAGGLAYGLDQLTGTAAQRQKGVDWEREMIWKDAAEGGARGASSKRDLFDRQLWSLTRNRQDAGGNRDYRSDLEENSGRLAGLVDMRSDSYYRMNQAAGRNGGEADALREAERRLAIEQAIEETYNRRRELVQRLQETERQTGERSLEIAMRVTQELENRARLAERRRDDERQNSDEAGLNYADANGRDRAKIQAVAAKVNRGEQLTPRERQLARSYGLREEANESARRQNAQENFGASPLGQALGGRVARADAAAASANDLVEASRKVAEIQRQELEKRLKDLYAQQLRDIADAVVRSQENQIEFAQILQERRAAAARNGAARP